MNIIEQLRQEEGEVLHVYKDHLGYYTIGVGILVDKRKGGGLRKEESEFILNNRIKILTNQIEDKLPWFKNLNPPRQAVLIGMAFQMGMANLLDFKNTLKLVEAGNYKGARDNMLQSKWAQQTPERATRMANQMETGQWQMKS